VFEYVGELLTNVELLLRMKECMEHGDYAYHYTIHLDANWGFEEEINDGEALCLDGQYFGNISRFLNHKCEDVIFINIHVKMGHHVTKYYHVSARIIWLFIMPFDLGGINQNSKYMNA
jgi:hypothetical protein